MTKNALKTVAQPIPFPPHMEQAAFWIRERESIRQKKDSGLPPPWTQDPMMAGTRWCNVRRMDDKVSKWLLDHFYVKNLPPAQMAVGAALARLINRPETLIRMCPSGYQGFDNARFRKVLRAMKAAKEQIFTGVYIINGAQANGRDKWELVLDNLDGMRRALKDKDLDLSSMSAVHTKLMETKGLGSFLAGQVVADLRHVLPQGQWLDRNTWAPVGPGSTKGLNYVFNTPGERTTQARFNELLPIYVKAVNKMPGIAAIARERKLEAHDYQNTLCEISKWARLREGGRSKNKYQAKPPGEQLTLL
jgi:hypothetical protein